MHCRPTNRASLLGLLAALLVLPSTAAAQTSYGDNGDGGGRYQSEYDYESGGGTYDDEYYDGSYDPYYEDDYEQYDDSYEDEPSPPAETEPQPPPAESPAPQPPAKKRRPPAKTPTIPAGPPVATIAGRTAVLQSNGKAAIPRGAPKRVRKLISAGNRLIGKPYKWGGGHAKLNDSGYDCSGTVSYALIGGTLLNSPMVSGSFMRWGSGGEGRYVTIYANKGHIYMEVAGLRLDTSPIGDYTGAKGPRWRPVIGKRKGFKVRHPAGL